MSREVEVLISKEEIEKRVKELSREIESCFSSPFTVISLLNGGFIFTADLVRSFKVPVNIDFMRVKSYKGKSRGSLELLYPPELNLKDKKVLLVDDIFDSGESLNFAVNYLKSLGAKEVKTCVLLFKERKRELPLKPDFFGFKVPDFFVVGYGLDLNGMYRQIPYIGILKE
ncbi:hypoxanthine phosphoribosyltransferase [Thermovibrio sp.]